MISTVVRFVLLLTILMGAAFGIQSSIQHSLKIGALEHFIVFNYAFNYIIATITLVVLIQFHKRKSNKLGFIFLYSSMVKFLLFFIFIKPQVDTEQGVKSIEFATFFIPYGISAITETAYLVRLLKRQA